MTAALDRCTIVMFQFCHAVYTVSFTHSFCVAQFRVPVISPRFHLIFQPVTGAQLLTVVTVL